MVYLLEMVIFHGKLLNNQMVYDIYIQSMHIYAMKEFHRTSHPHSQKKTAAFFSPNSFPFSKNDPQLARNTGKTPSIPCGWMDLLPTRPSHPAWALTRHGLFRTCSSSLFGKDDWLVVHIFRLWLFNVAMV